MAHWKAHVKQMSSECFQHLFICDVSTIHTRSWVSIKLCSLYVKIRENYCCWIKSWHYFQLMICTVVCHVAAVVGTHYNDVIMSTMASQITCVSIVCSTVCSGADQIQHQSSASLAFVRGIHRLPLASLHKWLETGKMFPFDDVIMWVPD